MDPGTVIEERFEIERRIASGGMGHVYRARDRLSGGPVALKILHGTAVERPLRFQREAEALSALAHPRVVRYVANGTTASGIHYLVMEWLEGMTLTERLAHGPLTVDETREIAAALADGLAFVHERGFIHRDLKPSNIFLLGGALDRAVLVDFGLARRRRGERELTVPGAVLGTIGYLAPEQARGAPGIDARADVFALGCVLYRCLAGVRPFSGDDDLSVLLKIVVEDPPRLRELRADVPSALDDFVARLLAKDPAARPRDGAAVLARLAMLDMPLSTRPPRAEIGASERRVMGLVLTGDPLRELASPRAPAVSDDRLRATVERHGGQIEILADRSSLVVFGSTGEATDLAARAARCALSLRALLPDVPVVVVSGRADPSLDRWVGDLVDRAVGLRKDAPAIGVRVDDATLGLLGPAFDVDPGGLLRAERASLDGRRTLLGRATPCVGRDRELAVIEDAYQRCITDVAAAAVLVTAAAGLGKSRLCIELLARLRRRADAPEIWIGRGDPMSAGSAFGLLGSALRGALGITDGAPLEARRAALGDRVAACMRAARPVLRALPRDPPGDPGASEITRITEFLGELVGAPFPDEGSVQLRAARRDPVLLGDQMRRAFEDFVRAACSVRPVILVLEDLHWGDLPTVKLVDAALRHLEARPFMVLASGRPEVHEIFPSLWSGRGVQEMHLSALPRRAAAQLARDVLGRSVTDEVVDHIVERADGNALYLEELIRAVAAGRGATLPESVLAMAQARLEALDPDERRILRAASVFGQAFRAGGVAALLGGASARLGLAALAEREVITSGDDGRSAGGDAFRFRHALLREAAYGMLTDADRAVGHLLAGEWLEESGERDAMVLAEHFERGGEPARAAAFYRRAAEQAFEGNDLDAALLRAARGLRCAGDAESPLAGALRLVQAKASRWLGNNRDAEQRAVEAMRLLPSGGASWCEAAAEVVHLSGKLGDLDRVIATAEALLALDRDALEWLPDREADASHAIALARAAMTLQLSAGRQALAEVLLARAEEIAARAHDDPAVAGQVHWARSLRVLAAGDVTGFLALVQRSRRCLARAGDLRSDCIQALNAGHGYLELGAYEEAERILHEARAGADRMGLGSARAYADLNLGPALLGQGRIAEARAVASDVLALFQAQADRPREAIARTYLALILTHAEERSAAAREALAVADGADSTPAFRAYARAILADLHLAEERPVEALAEAERAMSILTSLDGIEEGESLIRLVYAESLAAAGDAQAARSALVEARDLLFARAAKILDPTLRQTFLDRVPENARTLARARASLD
ncbi:Adenylate cyclase [Minicystis rosea]|nr:Adenylate cyclase [Minicystis rosea]